MSRRTKIVVPAAPALAALPELPAVLAEQWAWAAHPTTEEIKLVCTADGFATKWYFKPDRAIAEAERRVLSAPAPSTNGTTLLEVFAGDIQHAIDVEHATAAADLLRRSSPEPLPLIELMQALTDHADGLPQPLPIDLPLPIPAGLPERFPAPRLAIVRGRYQPRTVFDEAKLAELAESIQAHGIINPLIVFANERGQLELVAGERRLKAAERIDLAFVPIELRSYTLRQIAEISAIDNLQREDLTPLEEGACYDKLIADLAISEAELARRIGRNRGYIQQRRYIASATPEIHTAMADGTLTFTQARTIVLAAPGDHSQQKKALKAVAEQLRNGKRPTEQEVKALADATILKGAIKQLEALGWQQHEGYQIGTVLYAAGERPRVWSGAEILEAVRAGRRPSGKVPPAHELTEDQARALSWQGYHHSTLGSWTAFRKGYHGPYTYLTPAELVERGAATAAEVATVVEQFAHHGWMLEVRDYWSRAAHPDGASRALNWENVPGFLAELAAGTVSTVHMEPRRDEQTCARCQKRTTVWAWIGNGHYCQDCQDIVRAELLAEKESRTRRAAAATAALTQLPPELLRLLAAVCQGSQGAPPDAEQACQAIERVMVRAVCLYDSVAALLPPDPGAPPTEDGPRLGSLKWITQQLDLVERQIADRTTHSLTAAELETLGEELEDLSEVLDDVTYEDLSGRIDRALEQVEEAEDAE